MSAFTSLLRREWLESRTPYLLAIVGLLALVTVVGAITTLIATSQGGSVVTVVERSDNNGNSERYERSTDRIAEFADFSNWTNQELSDRLGDIRLTIGSAFHLVYFSVVIFVLMGCVYDQRKDRSVLFWKSMPVSDARIILSKLLVPVWLVPMFVVAALTLSWILLLLLLSGIALAEDLGSVTRLWAESGLLLAIVQELTGYAIQGLWSLPIFGWLILVSCFATRLPLLWVVLIPLIPVACERLLLGSGNLYGFISRHLDLVALPSLWEGDGWQIRADLTISDQLALLASVDLWLGVGVGLAMLAGARWCYQRNNEL